MSGRKRTLFPSTASNKKRRVYTNYAAQRAVNSIRRQASMFPRPNVMEKFASHAYRRRGTELKTLDTQFSAAFVAGGAYTADTQPFQQLNTNTDPTSVQAVNLAQQGVGIAQRDANKISMKSVRIRLSLNVGNAAAGNALPQAVRVMVIYDRQPNGAYPAMTTILAESLQNNTTGNGTWSSNLSANLFERFRVLMDKYITLPPEVGALANLQTIGPTCDGAKNPFQIDEFINLRDLETIFTANSNPMTIANIATGALYICSFGDTGFATQPWTWKGSVRLRFRDN